MSFAATPLRVTPSDGLLFRNPDDPAYQTHASVPEAILDIENIQGMILTGFNKDHRLLISYRVNAEKGSDRLKAFKEWLHKESSYVATAAEVIAFNRLFQATRARRSGEGTVKSTWLGLALSQDLLNRLTNGDAKFADVAFSQGLASHSSSLNDPTGDSQFAAKNWFVGGPGNEVDLFIILESDIHDDLMAESARLGDSIAGLNKRFESTLPIIQELFVDEGANLPPPISGHEHFGFLDGISQPGIRGLLSKNLNDPLTPRQNPEKRDIPPAKPSPTDQIEPAQGKPGQDLLHPGEFVFGYPRQTVALPSDPNQDSPNPIPGPDSLQSVPDPNGRSPVKKAAGPEWARNGSFLVYRRLRQDVGAFHKFLFDASKAHVGAPLAQDSGSRFVGSQLVGRWPSGCPVLRSPAADLAAIGNDDCANNNFEFGGPSDVLTSNPADPNACVDSNTAAAHPSPGDPDGKRCPFNAHVRKAYPRDDVSIAKPDGPPNESDTQTHRLLRRGLPYGPVSSSTFDSPDPTGDDVDRGLQFLCFQTSIDNQFEFVIKNWVNEPNFKEPFEKTPGPDPLKQGGGLDPILGQNRKGKRAFNIVVPADEGKPQKVVRLETDADWVHPTAGGYFFAPSLDALRNELTT